MATRSLIDVARRGRGDRGDDHWTERAGALVAPLLHAAALRHESLGALASRVDQRSCDDVVHELKDRYGDHHPAVALLHGVMATEERERSSIWSTASGLFAGVRTEAARASAREAPLDIDAFLAGPHQLHIVAPSRHQAVTIPLVVGLIEEVVHATYDRHEQGAGLLLALDELANVAPLPRLASIVSEGGGQGVLTLACLQDLSQARSRWGDRRRGVPLPLLDHRGPAGHRGPPDPRAPLPTGRANAGANAHGPGRPEGPGRRTFDQLGRARHGDGGRTGARAVRVSGSVWTPATP